jgi:hypothetical protein
METKVKRALTPKIYSYSAVCKNNKLFVSPDAGSGTVFREFFVDLEKAGFVKDGHVVPE